MVMTCDIVDLSNSVDRKKTEADLKIQLQQEIAKSKSEIKRVSESFEMKLEEARRLKVIMTFMRRLPMFNALNIKESKRGIALQADFDRN